MTMQAGWHFWIDRGGTCSDVVALAPGGVFLTRKLLSSHPTYADAAIRGIRDVLGLRDGEPIPGNDIASVKMGTTVVTNALLERRGEAVVLMVSEGLRDVLGI
jgi:5-oxoprolinase (ATP-hydrolysing)